MKTDVIARQMSERELLDNIIQMAHVLGWLVMHSRPAINRRGVWSTPLSGDSGFPDLCLARKGEILFIEVKRQHGKVTDGQAQWAVALCPHYFLAQPGDWFSGLIERVLQGKEK
jgi:hypothetical protein